MRLTSLFVLATAAVSGFAQTVADIQAAVTDISTEVTNLDSAITKFSSGATLKDAISIQNAAGNLKTTIDYATLGVQTTPGPVPEPAAQTILAAINAFEPTIEGALKRLAANKPIVDSLPGPPGAISALVEGVLNDLRSSVLAFANALIDVTPVDVKGAATNIRDKIDAAFAKAEDAYSAEVDS